MPSRWSRRLSDLLPSARRTPAPHAGGRSRLAVEVLEGRATPAVVATLNGTVLEVTLTTTESPPTSGALTPDSATITATDAGGTTFVVHDNISNTDSAPFTGVTAITVTDGGANAGQSVALNSAAGTNVTLTGALTATGVETVSLTTVNALQASSVGVTGATTINLGGSVTTVAGQNYDGPAIITGAAVVLTSTAAGDVAFTGTVNGLSPGPNSLTVTTDGNTSFGGVVGGTFPLSALLTNGAGAGTTSFAGSVTTTGAQTYNDAVTVSGAAVSFASTVGANITFNNTLDQAGATPTDVVVNTANGETRFFGSVGSTAPIKSLATNGGTGATVIGNGGGAITVATQAGQAFNDPVRLDAATVTFSSATNGDLLFAGTLNGTTAGASAAVFNTGGVTTFTGAVGATNPLASVTTDSPGPGAGQTVIRAGVSTNGDQNYADAVTVTAATGVNSVALVSSGGTIVLGGALTETTATPVAVRAGVNLVLNADVTLMAGVRFTAQSASSGTGTFAFNAGRTVKADVQFWQAGDGTGTANTTAVSSLRANAPAFRNAAGTAAPQAFAVRQDGTVTDTTAPALAQFGTALPAQYAIASDDGSIVLTAATTDFTGAGAAGLTGLLLQGNQGVSLGATITAPVAVVRVNSAAGGVTQTAGGLTAAGLGVRALTGIDFSTVANTVTGAIAALTTTGNVQFQAGAAVAVGSIGTDPFGLGFTAVSGVTATAGTVAFTQAGATPLVLTVNAPVSGTTVTAAGGTGNDQVTINYTLGATLAQGLTFAGGGGTDALILTDAGGSTAHTYAVNTTLTRDTNAAITFTDVESVSVTGGSGSDTFTVTPDATAAVTLAGGTQAATPATGDQLTVDLTGTTTPVLTATRDANGVQGSASFGNRQPVNFSQMETVNPQADIQVTTSGAPANVEVRGSATLTVVVTNAGAAAATGVSLTDVIPAGMTATWTAAASAGSTVAAGSGTGDINTTADLAAGGTVTFTITLTAAAGFTGSVTNTFVAGTSATAFDPTPANNQSSTTFTVSQVALTAAGAGAGAGPRVKVFNADGSVRFDFFAYEPTFTGGVTVATGDVTGDGVEDIVTGSATAASRVKVFDGKTGAEIANFFAFPGFSGGVNVAVANGQVVAGAGVGGGPVVKGFSLANGGVTETFSFLAFEGSFRGGVQVGGSADRLVVGAGPGGGPHVRVFDAATLTQTASFFAFPLGSTDGVSVAIGSLNGQETVVVGAGPGSTPVVATFDAATAAPLGSVLAFDAGFKGGVRVAPAASATGAAATAYGPGNGGAPRIRILTATGAVVLDTFAFDAAFTGGVFVG